MDRSASLVTLVGLRIAIATSWVAVVIVVFLVETRDVPPMLALYVWLAIFVLLWWTAFIAKRLWNAVARVVQAAIMTGAAVVLLHLVSTIALVSTKGWEPEGAIYDFWALTSVVVGISAVVAPALVIAGLVAARNTTRTEP